MSYPSDFKYTKEHEWIKADGTTATIGITSYAQESLGDIVFVELPKPGAAPATGTVTEVNGDLATAPEKINQDAHSSWMLKIKLKNPGELNALLSSADYEKFVAEEGGH
ncbi:MAG: glycine cleavage system protein H [Acidobacteria bacterium]|nr:MAG: glycine cleavage system protein H [Acidobacteriota bacterium]